MWGQRKQNRERRGAQRPGSALNATNKQHRRERSLSIIQRDPVAALRFAPGSAFVLSQTLDLNRRVLQGGTDLMEGRRLGAWQDILERHWRKNSESKKTRACG